MNGNLTYLLFWVLLLPGCYRTNDNPPKTRTCGKLIAFGDVIKQGWREKIDVRKFDSLPNLILVLHEKKLVDDWSYEDKEYEVDGWGRPFRWEKIQTDNKTMIRILSAGQNGLWEDGQGDDLYMD